MTVASAGLRYCEPEYLQPNMSRLKNFNFEVQRFWGNQTGFPRFVELFSVDLPATYP